MSLLLLAAMIFVGCSLVVLLAQNEEVGGCHCPACRDIEDRERRR